MLTRTITYEERTFTILWYAKPVWVLNGGLGKILDDDCEFKNCEVTYDIHKLNKSDAVLFHHSNMGINPPPKPRNQKWIFVSLESPVQTRNYFNQPKWHNKFDWTYTYRNDSDVFAPYSKFVRVDGKVSANYTAIFLSKTKDVAWVVSHCNTHSKRELYVKKMKEVIQIDIYGRCGQPCNSSDCFKMISKKYKFYLSFENSLCKDYVTEKLYRLYADNYHIVPVVRGAPNVKEIMPSNTGITTSDFKSPKDLATYLQKVGRNEFMYTKYLRDKNLFRKKGSLFGYGACEVCKSKNLNRKVQSKRYSNIGEWLYMTNCLKPSDV